MSEWIKLPGGAYRLACADGVVDVEPVEAGWRWHVCRTRSKQVVPTLEEAKEGAVREAMRYHAQQEALLAALLCREGWSCEELEEGVCGYYLRRPPLTFAIWGVLAHAPADQQRWAWAITLTGEDGKQVSLGRANLLALDALPTTPQDACGRMVAAYEDWRRGVVAPLRMMEVAG